MKLLKQFLAPRAAYTSLKRGVNGRAAANNASSVEKRVLFVRSSSTLSAAEFISLTPDFSRVLKNANNGNRFNGFASWI